MKTHGKFCTGSHSTGAWRVSLLFGTALVYAPDAWPGGTVTSPTEAALRAALVGGGL